MAENAIVSAGKWQVVLLLLRTTSTCSAGLERLDWRGKKKKFIKIFFFHRNVTLQER
jgi:hypothetical protein